MMARTKKLGLAAAASALLGAVVLLLFSGADTRFGLTESDRKDLIDTFVAAGEEAEAAALAMHPEDEDAQMEVLRANIEEIHARVIAKFGVTQDQADEIFREARDKGWW